MSISKISKFTDLFAWQEGHTLVLLVYKASKQFPHSEIYSLVDQMRRCVVSITSNIAEGFSRRSKREKNQFYYTSLGSITELQNQLIIAKDLGYLSSEVYSSILNQTIRVHKLMHGLLKSSRDHT